jgi:hypothetical protein
LTSPMPAGGLRRPLARSPAARPSGGQERDPRGAEVSQFDRGSVEAVANSFIERYVKRNVELHGRARRSGYFASR